MKRVTEMPGKVIGLHAPKFQLNRKAILMTCFLLLGSVAAWAQGEPAGDPLFPVYLILGLILAVLILVVVAAAVSIRVLALLTEQAAQDRARKLGIPYVPELGPWERLWQNANAMVPIEEERNIELEHNYDGIRELDNHLPPWWKGLFYGCIVFAVVYMAAYHVFNSMPLSDDEYLAEVAVADAQARALLAAQPPEVVDEANLKFTKEPEKIAHGRIVFMSSNCGSCHRNDGGGSIGPNLTDGYWLHGGEVTQVYATIKNGYVEKAMPAWGKVMNQRDLRDVAFYVMSLQGSNPKDAKAPQGELFKPKPEPIPKDTSKVQASIKP